MLAELCEYLLTPVARPLRSNLRSAIGIRSRARRLSHAWAPHLQKTQQFLTHEMQRCQRRELAIILGAGLHHDIPVATLASAFKKVLLVDIVHPAFSAVPLMRYRNVHRVHLDLNGRFSLDQQSGILLAQTHSNPIPALPSLPSCDFLASVNVASQLALDATTEGNGSSPQQDPLICIQRHVDEMRSHSAERKVFISDRWVSRSSASQLGDINSTEDALHGVLLRTPDQEWEWNLAPAGEISRDTSVHCVVNAWSNAF
jgi:hypothetical protein